MKKIEQLMEQFQNGERKAVEGPLDFLQALALVQSHRDLMSALKNLIDTNNDDPNRPPVPKGVRAAAHYTACKAYAVAEQL